ncbi:MAG TPA: polysulfide reductase NrfD [Polyangiaceae bacterium]|mgnify:CR=1 FL=1|jgi:molybdopterin-containing oxidoreductase family membrane subunit|nr:MAG: Polysulfide reductase, NrfD [Deltaproteobacteria bacterium ADurb.Bin207]HNZ24524.1 polysulfide reductase NrfD [Polyangiaceae bacterium]HOD21990.1 polysulfide reductase NrfD [Polyangiaceae bacterium]HOE47956.1 polysulfide reductase NrfD [Polyangiaceae bacterium]HOH02585.1 polysulfide reductase NrfD [Polyangiaceae bacterium]
MFEKVFQGSSRYYAWVGALLVLIGIAAVFYLQQLQTGLGITGLGRDVTWGFYIAQLTFLVGVAASAVMVVLPYYLHNYKAFGKMTVLGEFLAVSACTMCLLFVVVDIGSPQRAMNLFFHPTPNSILFWDAVVINGYLLINALVTRVSLVAERKGEAPPTWIKPVIYLSIPWAVSIHTVTAFLYAGLGARPFWLTAILAPRFLASAFASGPSFLILLLFALKKFGNYDVGKEPILKLAQIVTYGMLINVFFVAMEMFTAFYSGSHHHTIPFQYLYVGLDEHKALVPWMWTSAVMAIIAIAILVNPKTRNDLKILPWACVLVFASIWIDKGMGMVVTGFIPNPVGHITEYMPTLPEMMISLGIYAFGFLMITVFYKIYLGVRESIV